MVPDVGGDHSGWELPPVGRQTADREAYAMLVHGIASRPRPKPITSVAPAAGGPPRSCTPPNPRDQGPGGYPPHPPHARHGMLRALWH